MPRIGPTAPMNDFWFSEIERRYSKLTSSIYISVLFWLSMTVLKQIITHLSQLIERVTVKSVPTFPFLFPHLFQIFFKWNINWSQLSQGSKQLLISPAFGSMFRDYIIPNGDSDVGDIVMLVTLWWWLISDVGGRIIMLATFFVMLVI